VAELSSTKAEPPPDNGDLPVGAALARLRRNAGVTGQRLAQRLRMSQAKISKIETGVTSPSPQDVERIARELGAPASEVRRLREQAEHSRDQMVDWRAGQRDPTRWQREIANLESEARDLRVFSPAVISGLLQTSEFARSVLTSVQEVWHTPSSGIGEAVTARVQRQEVLDDPSKRFHFLMPEAVLHNLLARAEDMPAQLTRLLDASRQANITISFIPQESRLAYPPYHGFSLLDDRLVIIDLYNTVVVTRGRADIRLYQHVFDALAAQATQDVEPILDRYRRLYLKMAQES
jgi:transcriptional regulator with XRE-family HTH domain